MPIRVELRNERGELIRALADPAGGTFDAAGDFDRLLQLAPGLRIPTSDVAYTLLQYVDPYGDTVFNNVQMPDLLDDIDRAARHPMNDRERRGLDRLRAMAERCRNATHLYLWFVGD